MRTPHKLMTELTGRETYAAVYSCFLAKLAGKEPAFTENDLTTAINALEKRRPEAVAYSHWCEASAVIDRLQCETRVEAMKCCWRLSLLVMNLNRAMQVPLREQLKEALQPAALTETAQCVGNTLHNIALMRLMLEAFGEVLELDVVALVRRELRQVEQCLALYHRCAEHYDDDQSLRAGAEELLNGVLPSLAMLPATVPQDYKPRCIEAIYKHQHSSLYDALDVMLECYREV